MKKYKVKLRAKEKCYFCTLNEVGEVATLKFPRGNEYSTEFQVLGNKLNVCDKFKEFRERTFEFPIKYCPFCGRKLEGEADEQ